MHILITGAAGMLGQKVIAALADPAQAPTATHLTLVDIVPPSTKAAGDIPTTVHTADLAQPGTATALVSDAPDAVIHLAAMVSAAAERDLRGGYTANVDAMRTLLDALPAGKTPRFVFASSLAVFGPPLPDVIDDHYIAAPQSSYGTQKAMCELLLDDYSRKGLVDGVGLRLPTLSVRPGKPNAAASGFLSGILREPLNGQRATLPVGDDYTHWFASPRAAVGFVRHALTMDTAALGHSRTLNMPGVSLTVGDLIAALTDHAGPEAAALIDRTPDPEIEAIVTRWAKGFTATRARALGFTAETSAAELLDVYLQDHMS